MGITKPTIEQLIRENEKHYCAGIDGVCVKMIAVADLPSRFGQFQVVAFYNNQDGKEHAAFVKGDVCGKEDVPVRLHSECLTGDAIGSLRCDCRDQLEQALKSLGNLENGILLYLRQEGRGIGLVNKIKAYQLQDEGYDTVQANEALGFRNDERDYDIAAHMLKSLDVRSIRLISNNPAKIKDLQRHGVRITGRIPIIIEPSEFNRFYLETKKNKSGHMLDKDYAHDVEQDDSLTDEHHEGD